jgi:serine/threonine-protein kinase HipA
MTKRFDREGNDIKHHIQTWCGMQHLDFQELYSYSYEQLFQTMRLLRLTYPEAEQMFKRMVFNVIATNYDDHTKNFSFRLKKGGRWELSPAYDICYSYDPNNVWVNQLTLSINGKRKNITIADFMTIAKANNIKKAEQLIEEIKSIVQDWEKYAEKANVRPDLAQLIKTNLNV